MVTILKYCRVSPFLVLFVSTEDNLFWIQLLITESTLCSIEHHDHPKSKCVHQVLICSTLIMIYFIVIPKACIYCKISCPCFLLGKLLCFRFCLHLIDDFESFINLPNHSFLREQNTIQQWSHRTSSFKMALESSTSTKHFPQQI